MGRTRVDHGAGVALDVERVHDHLPHPGECARRTLLARTVTLVRDPVVHGERPQWVGVRLASLRGRNHGRVIEEAKLFHHHHLGVPADPQEGHANAAQVVQRDARKLVDYVGHACKLVEPVLHCGVESPPELRLLVGDRVDGYFVAVVPEFLHVTVVGVLVRQEESCLDGAPVCVGPVRGEYLLVDFPILVVDSIVECQHNHLWGLIDLNVAWNSCSVGAAKTIWQSAVAQVATLRCVWIVLGVAIGLVRVV